MDLTTILEPTTVRSVTTLEPITSHPGNGIRTKIRATEKALDIAKILEQESKEFQVQVLSGLLHLLNIKWGVE